MEKENPLEMLQAARKQFIMQLMGISFAICFIAMPLSALIIGAIFHGQCLIEPNISVYLIVMGSVWTTYAIISIVFVSFEGHRPDPRRKNLFYRRLTIFFVPKILSVCYRCPLRKFSSESQCF